MADGPRPTSSSGPTAASDGNAIKVVLRFRPQNKVELANNGFPIVQFLDDKSVKVESKEYPGTYSFDRVFDWNTKQVTFFDYAAKPIVQDLLNGINGTIFAYGQTGSGKTYTMMGYGGLENQDLKGLIPRTVEAIFDAIVNSTATLEFTVKVSFMELYNEKIRDLLQPTNDNLPIHEEKSKGIYVKGLTEVYVSTVEEVFDIMEKGSSARIVAATNMNETSSRSHSIFILTINQKNLETQSNCSAKLYLVDLAGSEKVGKTGATGQTFEEAKKINLSLSALGNVINALTDGKSQHVPYRDSKLTRILQESLGGNSRTTLIINSSPSSYNEAETLSTLRFGTRAKRIENKAKVNRELSATELKAMLKKAKEELADMEIYVGSLEKELKTWRSGGKVDEPVALKEIGVSGDARPKSASGTTSGSRLSVLADANVSALSEDERDTLLKRENELVDQITEKESEIKAKQDLIQELQEKLTLLKDRNEEYIKENQELGSQLRETQLQLEKAVYDNKETDILLENLQEENSDLHEKIKEFMAKLDQYDVSGADSAAIMAKEKEKMERMAAMMSSLDSTNDPKLQFSLKSTTMNKYAQTKEAFDEHVEQLRIECQRVIGSIANDKDSKAAEALLSSPFKRLRETFSSTLNQLCQEIETAQLSLTSQQARIEDAQEEGTDEQSKEPDSIDKLKQNLSKQAVEFDQMKRSLMKDLQDRCERVVELEILLDEARAQQAKILKSNNSQSQQQKMAMLERNLTQLTSAQKQIVEQNTTLKKELGIAEKKLAARDERVQHLEELLKDIQERMIEQTKKHAKEMEDMENKMTELKAQKTTQVWTTSHVAKPIRGRRPSHAVVENMAQ